MLVQDIIQGARDIELKQLKIKEDTDAIIRMIRLGMLELHKRFDLLQDEAIITMADGVFIYTLDGVDPNVTTIDLSDKQLMTIVDAYDEQGLQMTINDEHDDYGLTTPRWNQVELPDITAGGLVSIIFRAAPKIVLTEKTELPLPPQFEEAMLAYIGYRGHLGLSGDEQSESNPHWKRFNGSCDRIVFHGLTTMDALTSSKFEDRGFV